MSHRSIPELLQEVCAANSQAIAYRYVRDGQWADMRWSELDETVRRVARGLMALGVAHGDRVAILSNTRLEWILADLGTVTAGAVTVGIYHSTLADQCQYILDHSGASILFLENSEQLAKLEEVRSKLRSLRRVVILDGDGVDGGEALTWQEFLRLADEISPEAVAERAGTIGPQDLASLVYTSGTTGVPKGVMITHDNLLFATRSSLECLYIEPDFVTLLFLPLAHVFARLIVYLCLRRAIKVVVAADIAKVPQYLKEIRPHFFASVPRVFEKVHDKVVSTAESAGGVKTRLFRWAIGVGQQVSRLKQAGESVSVGLRLRHGLADRLVLHKIRDAFGGRLAYCVSGSAPLNQTIAEFFDACGVLILEGIGMTENTSFSHVNRFDNNRFGSVGQPGPGIETRIAEDGEVLFRGANVMKGYYRNAEATREAIDADGWLHSGDIGEIDHDGFLRITDRKKDLIVTAGGKNVAPQRIERIVRTSHFISQVMAYGDRRKYITALITLDPPAITDWAARVGLGTTGADGLATHPRVRELIAQEIEQLNLQLASFESIKRFHILPVDFSIEGGELTPTLKIRRKVVQDKYASELEALYAG